MPSGFIISCICVGIVITSSRLLLELKYSRRMRFDPLLPWRSCFSGNAHGHLTVEDGQPAKSSPVKPYNVREAVIPSFAGDRRQFRKVTL
jgi:hypothetical protein